MGACHRCKPRPNPTQPPWAAYPVPREHCSYLERPTLIVPLGKRPWDMGTGEGTEEHVSCAGDLMWGSGAMLALRNHHRVRVMIKSVDVILPAPRGTVRYQR